MTRPLPDLDREVHCLFGLVFDAVTLEQAAARIRRHVDEGSRCFMTTPNVNFVVASQRDAFFRESVLDSDLSVADGAPIVWAARLMGIPLPERVAGSDLFERLRAAGGPAASVYFFGGPDGVAELACQRLNGSPGGLRCVGFDSPGFGSVAELSGDERIDRINAATPDFLVVSLGARKGQEWIVRNLGRLGAPVVSHLGAVVNFVAGRIQRAPRLVARLGLEWLWRIKEEPGLWRRYWSDAQGLAKLVITQVLPCAVARLARQRSTATPPHGFTVTTEGACASVHLTGSWSHTNLTDLKRAIQEQVRLGRSIQFDLGGVTAIDSAFVGLMVLLNRWQPFPSVVIAATLTDRTRQIFRWHGAHDQLLGTTPAPDLPEPAATRTHEEVRSGHDPSS